MPARSNKRVIYPHTAVAIRPTSVGLDLGGTGIVGTDHLAYGVQELGISTNFDNTPYFQLGMLDLYDDVEELPDIEVNITKALDGKPLLYHLATSSQGLTSPTLAGRQNAQSVITVGIFSDTNDYSTGSPASIVEMSGMYPSSLEYTFPVDDTFRETMTLVGNDKIWLNDSDIVNSNDLTRSNALAMLLTNQFNADTPVHQVSVYISGAATLFTTTGLQRRQHLNFTPWSVFPNITKTVDANGMAADPFCTILPPDVDGISSSGVNNKTDGFNFDAHVQNITVSVDLGRDSLDELGRRGPYHRFINFPVEVTCAVEILSTSGDMVSATENGIRGNNVSACASASNLTNRTIRVATCHHEVFYLGTKNKLTSVEMAGGGTDGGNQTITYNFRNYNSLTIMAFSDPHDDGNHVAGNTGAGFWNRNVGGIENTGTVYTPGANYLVNY